MLLFGHAGLTVGAAIAGVGIWRRKNSKNVQLHKRRDCSVESLKTQPGLALWDPVNLAGIDIRVLLIGSLLPDIIDKPVGLLIFANGRTLAHTILFAVLLGALAFFYYSQTRRNWLLVLFAGTVAHLILDGMWGTPGTIFWPLFGFGFPRRHVADWVPGMLQGLVSDPVMALGELVGLTIALWFGIILLRRKNVSRFIRWGRVD